MDAAAHSQDGIFGCFDAVSKTCGIVQHHGTADLFDCSWSDNIIADLTKAYAGEWLARYQYWLAARWIRGLDGDILRHILIGQSNNEL
jgi:hypothetical protein